MANQKHLALLKKGVQRWNAKRPDSPDLSGADLSRLNLTDINLMNANLDGADLSGAVLKRANLWRCKFRRAALAGASFYKADLSGAQMPKANLTRADLYRVNFTAAQLSGADLSGARLEKATLVAANLTGASLVDADLTECSLSRANVKDADFSGARVFGAGVWDIRGTPKSQNGLIFTRRKEPDVTVDNLKVAQFVYLLQANPEIRDVINTITSKVVLILGRFSKERKPVLDGLREKLRDFDLVPMVFDFAQPKDKDYTETVQTLAGMSMFVIADLTNPKSTPLELEATVKQFKIPYLPIIDISVDPRPFAMLVDLQNSFHWVLPTLGYESKEDLLDDENLKTNIIDRAVAKREELRKAKSREPEPLLICKKKVTTSPL